MGGTGRVAKWCRVAASSPTPSVVRVPFPNSSTMHSDLAGTQQAFDTWPELAQSAAIHPYVGRMESLGAHN